MLVNKLLLHVEENYDNVEQHTSVHEKTWCYIIINITVSNNSTFLIFKFFFKDQYKYGI